MTVVEIEKSLELCSEAGWYGYDVSLSEHMTEAFILELKKLGRLVYLPALKQPFFKVENKNYIIKGICGTKKLRIGVAYNDQSVLNKIIEFITKV